MRLVSIAFLILLGLSLGLASVAKAQDKWLQIEDIPSPRPSGWITDLTGSVSDEAVEYVNRVCDEVNEATKREMCVVVVGTIGRRESRTFATDLFNRRLRVGNSGVPFAPGDWRNNGVLLFFALGDKRVELILGEGIDSPGQERVAQKIIDTHVIPEMKNGNPDSAIYQGIRACATQLVGIAELRAPVMLPSVTGEQPQPRGPKREQRGPVTWWPWLAGGGFLGGVGLIIGGRYYYRYRPRECAACKVDMVMLEEHQDDQFLNPAQQIEESLGSVDYDVWACLECEDVLRLRYGRLLTRYSKCPECRYVTVHKIERVLVAADYSHGGSVQVREDCQHCSFHRLYTYHTPKLVKSSSSGSGGSGIGGGSGGGFSSGFGGGRSAGGGASGSW